MLLFLGVRARLMLGPIFRDTCTCPHCIQCIEPRPTTTHAHCHTHNTGRCSSNPTMEEELKKVSATVQRALRAPKAKCAEIYLEAIESIDSVLSSCEADFTSISLTLVLKEALQSLMDLLSSSTTSSVRLPSNLITRALSLLTNLCSSEACLQYVVNHHRILSVLSALLPLLKDNSITQSLMLISTLTLEKQSDFHVKEVEPILKLCSNIVLSSSSDSDQLVLSLEVLVNLYKVSIAAQSWAKTHPQYEALQKKLVSLLSNKSVGVILVSLHLLAVLSLKEKLGEKIFKSGNLEQTVQLIMSIVCSSHDCCAIRNAVSLFKLLLAECDQFRQALISYSQLPSCLKKALKRLSEVNARNSAKILELLHVLCDCPDIAVQIAPLLFSLNKKEPHSRTGSGNDGALLRGVLELLLEKEPVFSVAVIQGLKLMRILVETPQSVQLLAQHSNNMTALLNVVKEHLTSLSYSEGEEYIRLGLKRTQAALSLLYLVVRSPTLAHAYVGELLDPALFIGLIRDQFEHNPLLNKSPESIQWSGLGASVAVSSLHLLILSDHNMQSQEEIKRFFQDPKSLSLMACTLQGEDQTDIQHSLHILNHMFTMDSQSIQDFSEVLVSERPIGGPSLSPLSYSGCSFMGSATPSGHASMEQGRMKDITNVPDIRENVDTTSVEELIGKFKSGLEIRDVRASEIMNLYEHKLKMMTLKENHLQDLLEAKAVALSQADRLLGQYRGKVALSDNEFEKMRSLLQDTERECERLRDQDIIHQRKQQEMDVQVRQLQSEKMQLLSVAEEYEQLKQSYQEQSARLGVAEKSVAELQWHKSELERQSAQLQLNNAELEKRLTGKISELEGALQQLTFCKSALEQSRGKCDELSTLVETKNSQITSLMNVQKKLENSLQEISKALASSEEKNKSLLQQNQQLICEKDSLQSTLSKLESDIKKLEEDNAALVKEVNLFSAVKDLISKGK